MPVVPDPSPFPTSGWVPDVTCCAGWSDYDPATQARAVALGTFIMWALTGRQFGLTQVVARPCNAPLNPPLYQTFPVNILNPWGTDGGVYWAPYIYNGEWHNAGCGGFDCCKYRCGAPLDGPVDSIVSVTVDGDTIDPGAYVVQDGFILKRTDGDCWPFCTDTFLVTYMRGIPVPPAANIALGDLVCQLALACVGGECVLPNRIRSLSRQGVSVEFVDPNAFADLGRTNIATVDQVVALYNPGGLSQPPVVMSPDTPAIRYQTWPSP